MATIISKYTIHCLMNIDIYLMIKRDIKKTCLYEVYMNNIYS